MKTIQSFQLLIVGISLVLVCSVQSLKAQVANPYPVTNNNLVAVGITITLFDNTCTPNGTIVQAINPSSTFSFPLPMWAYDVDIVVDWGGNPGQPVTQSTGPVNVFLRSGKQQLTAFKHNMYADRYLCGQSRRYY